MIMTTIMSLARKKILLPRFSRKERTSAIQIRNHSYQFNEGEGTETLRLLHRTPPPLHNVLPQSWLTWSGRSCTPTPTSKSSRISITEGIPFRLFGLRFQPLWMIWRCYGSYLSSNFWPHFLPLKNTFPGFSEGMRSPSETTSRWDKYRRWPLACCTLNPICWRVQTWKSPRGNRDKKLPKHVTPPWLKTLVD